MNLFADDLIDYFNPLPVDVMRLQQLRRELGELPLQAYVQASAEGVRLSTVTPDSDAIGRWEGEGGACATS